jgi:hypothetical protein
LGAFLNASLFLPFLLDQPLEHCITSPSKRTASPSWWHTIRCAGALSQDCGRAEMEQRAKRREIEHLWGG